MVIRRVWGMAPLGCPESVCGSVFQEESGRSMATTTQQTVGTLASQAVERYLQQAESYEKAVIQDRDPEDLHQMRVSLRKLRTVMQVFAPGIALPKAGKEPKVADTARRLSQLRDLDVIEAALREQYLPDLPEVEGMMLEVVFDYLAKQRKKAYKRAKKTLRGDRYAALKRNLHDWTHDPDYNALAMLDIHAVLPDLTLPLVSHLWLHPAWLVGVREVRGKLQPDTRLTTEAVDTLFAKHSTDLHGLRKQVKRVRYQLKVVAEFYGDRLTDDLARFGDLQDALGALQDSLVMEDFLHQALSDWDTQLPTLKALLVDSRHRAWKQWQTLQQHYLDPQNRQALRQLLMQPGTTVPDAEPKSKAKTARKSTTTHREAKASPPTKSTPSRSKAKSTKPKTDNNTAS